MNNNSTKLSTKLNTLLNEIEKSNASLSIRDMIQITGSKSFGILILFLSMPSALPIPAPIISTPFGIAIATLLIQIISGRKTPWLPEKINKLTISPTFAKKMLKFSINLLNKSEHLIHPRWNYFCDNIISYILLLILTFIMILPLPLTNTAPAAILFLFSIGLIESDGIVCLIACSIGLILICLYITIAYLILTLGVNTTVTLIKNTFH